MSPISLFWMILYGVSTLAFFSVALAITIFGIQDLRSLLSKANRKDDSGKNYDQRNQGHQKVE